MSIKIDDALERRRDKWLENNGGSDEQWRTEHSRGGRLR